MKRAARCALLLAGALATGPGPAVGQSAGRGAGAPASALGGDVVPSAGVRSTASARRRDPFVNPLRRSGAPAATVRPRGLAGIAVDELALRGLVRFAGAYVAVLETGNGTTHLLRGGERLLDGSVRSVTAEGVLIVLGDPAGRPVAGGRTMRLTWRAAAPER